MQFAFSLIKNGSKSVSPRPMVGAVVVKDGNLVSKGTTERKPGRHAEAVALDEAKGLVFGSTLYSTLEPHGFESIAEPCTDRIIKAGVKHVVVGLIDQNKKVSGEGIKQLRKANVKVTLLAATKELSDFYAPYNKFVKYGLPYVTLKMATSLDAKIATKTGTSKWITGSDSRAVVAKIRHQSDILITGIGTVISDDPRLSVRGVDVKEESYIPICVFDSNARLKKEARLLKGAHVVWFVAEDQSPKLKKENLVCIPLKRTKAGLDLKQGLEVLAGMGYANALIEAGSGFCHSLLDNDLVDRLEIFIAPISIGSGGIPFSMGLGGTGGLGSLEEAKRWEVVGLSKLKSDIHLSLVKKNV